MMQQQLHQMVVNRRAGGLDEQTHRRRAPIRPMVTEISPSLKVVTSALPTREPQVFRDLLGQQAVGGQGKDVDAAAVYIHLRIILPAGEACLYYRKEPAGFQDVS